MSLGSFTLADLPEPYVPSANSASASEQRIAHTPCEPHAHMSADHDTECIWPWVPAAVYAPACAPQDGVPSVT